MMAIFSIGIAAPAYSQAIAGSYRAEAKETKTSKTGEVRIAIDRWSTKSERHELIERLLDDGPEALVDGLRAGKHVGTLRTQDGATYELRYAHQLSAKGKIRRILVATDRPVDFWVNKAGPRSLDTPFSLIELRVKTDGSGEGMMSVASRINAEGDVMEFEDYAQQPIRLLVTTDRK
jgi:hypothetical protein